MKRFLTLVLALCMVVCILASCSGSNNDDLPNDDKEQNEENADNKEGNETVKNEQGENNGEGSNKEPNNGEDKNNDKNNDDSQNNSENNGEGNKQEEDLPYVPKVESTAGLEFRLNEDGKSYTVIGIGTCTATEIVIDGHQGLPVTSIGDYAFDSCSNIASVTFGSGVKRISYCAFYNCNSLTSITIPDSVTSIGDGAFEDCISLTNITIPDSVTYISSDTFYNTGYYNDESNWENNVLYIGDHLIASRDSISGTCIIKSGTKSIADCVFWFRENLTSITIPDSVISIGRCAFTQTGYYNDESNWEKDVLYIGNYLIEAKNSISGTCIIKSGTKAIADEAFFRSEKLTSITIPNSITAIGPNVFLGCSSLTNITIPDSVTSIGDSAFDSCYSLTSITIPHSVMSIGEHAFARCSNLTSINIDKSNSVYKSVDGNLYSKDEKVLIQYSGGKTDEDFRIPNNVTSIGDYAFCGCDNLKSITIPDSVTSIGEGAFDDCDSLTNVTIPNSITRISDSMFSNCYSLTNITIPNSVTIIGDSAFAWCDNLTNVTIPDSVTTIGSSAFYNSSKFTNIAIPNSVTSIGIGAFSGTGYDRNTSNRENGVLYIGKCLITAETQRPNSHISGDYIIKEGTKVIANYAFSHCDNLTSVTIPDSVTSIGNGTFYNCDSLTSINYHGTEEQWNAISKGGDWNSGVPSTCVITYNYTGE